MLQQLTVQHSVTQETDPIGRRTPVIQHHPRLTARAHDAMNFPHRASRAGRVMQHAVRINDIETFIGKRQVLAVGNRKIAALSIDRQVLARYFNRPRSEIDPGHLCAAPRELQKVRAHAAADFQQTRAGKIIEPHHLRHPWRVLCVAMSFDRVEKLERAELLLATVNRAARIFAPLLAGPLFFFRYRH